MLKKVLIILIGIVILSFLFVRFTGKKINDVTNINIDNITKIIFYDGRGGRNKPLMLEDKQKIKEFMGYLNGYVIKKVGNSKSTGWIHSAVFYDNDKKVMEITFVSPVIINGEYYRVIRGGLNTNKIDTFLKSISPNWNMS
ncbi:hypothetical protein [Clostridium sp.]|uniref:hypothetical protein n=1 Tax=Clostridium sp. TaxID=1506 RepID=UPI00261FD6C3|nr:hypothetical protein [uncultured Clostridium sp.]